MRYLNRIRKLARDGRRFSASRAMTLLEIMVVITIIGLVMGAVVVAVLPVLGCAKQKRVMMDFANIKQALDLYKAKVGRYPQSSEGLQALIASHLLEKPPQDSWNHDYVYTFEGGKFTLLSYGADGAQGGEGDDADLNSNMARAPCEEK